jgi:phosphatidylserine/phosphatidylglycerophosphate/cardiolipin synthase-like enzyme
MADPNQKKCLPTIEPAPIAMADYVSVIIDADDYFRHARAAMANARKRIMLVGWDFDARIAIGDPAEGVDGPALVGEFIYALVEKNPKLEVYLLRWDIGAMTSIFRGITPLTILKWMRHPRIHTKLDGYHPTGGSHHQKMIIIDEAFAFCGGIDVTSARWDTRAHDDVMPARKLPSGKAYPPWHDASTALQGEAARTLALLALERWKRATGEKLPKVKDGGDCWPEALEKQFNNVAVTVATTLPEMPDRPAHHGIEALYLDQISRAKSSIYIESQYFCSRKIAEAMLKRLEEKNGPEIVIINPFTADGWLEPIAMDTARARLFRALKIHDHQDRLRIYHPVTKAGAPIYVHAKILIADDTVLRVGSSNLNNRSMRLDSECDIAIDVRTKRRSKVNTTIAHVRNDLLAEHLGANIDKVTAMIAEKKSLIAAIEALRGKGRTLVPYEIPNLNEVEKWLADNEILDPEGPQEAFETLERRGLFRTASKWRLWRKSRHA